MYVYCTYKQIIRMQCYTLRSGLLGDQVAAEHLGSEGGHVARLGAEVHSTLEAVGKVAKPCRGGANPLVSVYYICTMYYV